MDTQIRLAAEFKKVVSSVPAKLMNDTLDATK